MALAVERALIADGLTIASGSVESGQFVTAPAPLDPARLPGLVNRGGPAGDAAWARAEYRLTMRLSIAPNGWMTSGLRARILAWRHDALAPGGSTPEGTPVMSNGTLEQTFMQAVGREVDRLAHLFPPGPARSPTPEKPAATNAPSP